MLFCHQHLKIFLIFLAPRRLLGQSIEKFIAVIQDGFKFSSYLFRWLIVLQQESVLAFKQS